MLRPLERIRCLAFALTPIFAASIPMLGCRDKADGSAGAAILPADAREVLKNYADIAFASYTDSALSTKELVRRSQELAASPDAARLAGVREAWIRTRLAYEQSEAFRFYGGPIDRVEFLVNTWPIDEEVIESSIGKTGLINDVEHYPVLSLPVLRAANGKGGETAITTGFHAIEFLLWGRDTSADGPGDRSERDFGAEAPLGARRAQYVELAGLLLQQNLEEVAAEWAPERPGNYRARFLSMPHGQALALVVRGMGSFSGPELMSERLIVAYETKDQENEHSCFSDTTHTDVWLGALGIQNLWLGRYRRLDGSSTEGRSLADLVRHTDASLGMTLTTQLEASVARARAIPAPFDQAILGADSQAGRQAVAATIAALRDQTAALARLPAALGVSLPLVAAER